MFKYNLGETVWYMIDNRIHSAKVGARTIAEVDSEFQKTRAGGNWSPKLVYGTIHGNWREEQLHRDCDALFFALKKNAVIG